jgi:transcriptional regulator with XRE-family HTH domain
MKLYKSYKFKNYDPILDEVDKVMFLDGMTRAEVSEASGVSTSTLYNWSRKKTRRPSATTINATLHALGYELVVAKKRNR